MSAAVVPGWLWGIALLAGGAGWAYWRWVHRPLRRLVEGIETMRRTGRLVTLPVMPHSLAGVVASGFNRLTGQLDEQQRRLRDHVLELQRLTAELDHLAALKDDFLNAINHQLRTPLTTLVEGLELVGDGTLGSLTPEQQQVVQAMDENANRLAALIEEVLDLSLLKSGRRPLHRVPGDLALLLRQTHTRWQHEAGTRTVQLSCPELPPIYLDAQAIQEVLDHLLHNALRHAPEHSDVRIHASRCDDRVVEVAVSDHGPGMTPAERGRLFQPFVHIQNPEAPGSRGSGLGLAFCRQALERHRGTIRAEAAPERGLTIAFTLPIASAAFLFEDAFLSAKEDAEFEEGQVGLLAVSPPAPHREGRDALDRIETVLRRHTHRGDRFVRVDETTLAIFAVTTQAGLEAMVRRLQGVLSLARLEARLGSALYPYDGGEPAQLLQVARRRLAGGQVGVPHVTMEPSASGGPA